MRRKRDENADLMFKLPEGTVKQELPRLHDGFGWRDWWKISVTNRLLRLACVLGGGLALVISFITGTFSASVDVNSTLFCLTVIPVFVLFIPCFYLDLRLVWNFPEFAKRKQALAIVHLFIGWALGLFFVWRYGVPILRELPLAYGIPLGIVFVLLGLASSIVFTLCIAGPSRVSTLCAFGSVLVSAVLDGAGVFTRIEVWSLLFNLLSIEEGWLTWVWTVTLGIYGICALYDRGEDILELDLDFE